MTSTLVHLLVLLIYISDIVDHLAQFEQQISDEDGAIKSPKLAKTMMVFMV